MVQVMTYVVRVKPVIENTTVGNAIAEAEESHRRPNKRESTTVSGKATEIDNNHDDKISNP